jgi:NAD+ diphosphatase
MSYAAVCGLHYNYFITHAKYCGVCGNRMVKSKIEMANVCPQCSNTKYPDIMPAIAVAIINNDRILLTKYRGRLNANYALVAGYCEVGESLEECVRREAKEETGLELYDIKYYMSQPWGFSNTMMIGFVAKSYHDNIVLQEEEVESVNWLSIDEINKLISEDKLRKGNIEPFKEVLEYIKCA